MSGAIARTEADDILEQGRYQTINSTAALLNFLFENGRVADAQKASKDPGLLNELLTQYEKGELVAKEG